MKLLERLQVGQQDIQDSAIEITKTTFSSIPFIAAGLVSAIVCSIYLSLFKKAEGLAFQTFDHHKWQFLVIAPLVFMVSTWIVRQFAPGNGGSGIPQVLATLEAEDHAADPAHAGMVAPEVLSKRFLNWKVLPVKMLSCVVGVIGGGGIGPEGPCVQLSAVIFRMARDWWQKLFGTQVSFYNMIVAGGASGIAAAFNTPLGGVMFAVEELAKSHIATFRLGVLEAVIACGFLSQIMNGPYLYLGFPVLPTVTLKDLLLVLSVSFVAGIAGAGFGVGLRKVICWRRALEGRLVYFSAAVGGFATALLIIILGKPAIGSGHELMKHILFTGQHHPSVFGAFLTSVARFVSPFFVACGDIAAGIFAPSLTAGASIGQFLGQAFDPALGNLAPICGMIGFLTGITRTPLTAFVIIMEMTDRHSAIFAMMLSAIVAFISARAVDSKSFYERMAEVYLGH